MIHDILAAALAGAAFIAPVSELPLKGEKPVIEQVALTSCPTCGRPFGRFAYADEPTAPSIALFGRPPTWPPVLSAGGTTEGFSPALGDSAQEERVACSCPTCGRPWGEVAVYWGPGERDLPF